MSKDLKERGKIQGNIHGNVFWVVYTEHCDKNITMKTNYIHSYFNLIL